jgi:hypothetical protein
MGGGLMQLVAYGAQDIYLTGNPQITFFKVVYRRHTNFSMEAIEQTINGQATAGSRVTSTISRNGDLISRIYHEIKFPTDDLDDKGYANIGANCFDTIEVEIGGQKIDKITGKWMEVWAELTEPNPTNYCGSFDNEDGTLFQRMSGMGGVLFNSSDVASNKTLVPLPFWFCRNPGLALPLIALQYHEVKLITTLSNVTGFNLETNDGLRTWVDYIYLDTDERRRFAQVSHEYLIEQLQYFSDKKTTFDLNFNHPVKEIIWTASQNASGIKNQLNFGLDDISDVSFQLKLNGHDRFTKRTGQYFTRAQVWQYHTGVGGVTPQNATSAGLSGQGDDSIAVYSFALKPEEHQPSGTCNFSRIDNAQLIATGTGVADSDTTIYAVNYNVLRIMSGMGGLAYSN